LALTLTGEAMSKLDLPRLDFIVKQLQSSSEKKEFTCLFDDSITSSENTCPNIFLSNKAVNDEARALK
jgi:hypothetical protein